MKCGCSMGASQNGKKNNSFLAHMVHSLVILEGEHDSPNKWGYFIWHRNLIHTLAIRDKGWWWYSQETSGHINPWWSYDLLGFGFTPKSIGLQTQVWIQPTKLWYHPRKWVLVLVQRFALGQNWQSPTNWIGRHFPTILLGVDSQWYISHRFRSMRRLFPTRGIPMSSHAAQRWVHARKPPSGSQRCHWNANMMGLASHKQRQKRGKITIFNSKLLNYQRLFILDMNIMNGLYSNIYIYTYTVNYRGIL